MRKRRSVFCVAIVILCVVCVNAKTGNSTAAPVGGIYTTGKPVPDKHFLHPDRIRYDGSCMTIDGKDLLIYSAAFHYFRVPEALWRDRFRKIKEAGFNTVETYIPWNWQERNQPKDINDQSKFDFRDLKAWLKMAQEQFGLYTIVRPGPFICAEWSGGAYPRWLAAYGPGKGPLWLRGADPEHIKWCLHWLDAVSQVIAPEQLTRKKKGEKGVILFQIENEYDAHGTQNKEVFLKALYNAAVTHGIDVPIFTCLTSQTRESKDPLLSQVFDCDNYYVDLTGAPDCARRMMGLKKQQPDAPGFVTELQGGWFSTVTGRLSEENYSDARHFKAIGLMSLLGGATGINYYMFVGGTHFAGWGARGMTTSYDYNAAIGESGAIGEKYEEAKAIGAFIGKYGGELARATGGPCALHDQGDTTPAHLFGGLRLAPDGTRFVFLHNTDPRKGLKGRITVMPGKMTKPGAPMYNINQYGEHVLMTSESTTDTTSVAVTPFELDYDLSPLGAKVLVIAPGSNATSGKWWPKETPLPGRPKVPYQPIRIRTALRTSDPMDQAKWKPIAEETSLTAAGINDFRYSLYRSKFLLTNKDTTDMKRLLLHMFTRDIVSAEVNGKIPKRLFPDHADAQTWVTRDADKRIRNNEFDNRFDLTGLLKPGANEIMLVYEDLGHAHGYVPMEELAGIRRGGLSATDSVITYLLKWELSADVAGVTQGFTRPGYQPKGWETIQLNTTDAIARKGNGIQPKAPQTGLFTWYRIEFTMPDKDPRIWVPWLAKINASGNGYMWLNGHNIGRHWEAGPQRSYFLPECWLNYGKKNVLVLGLRQTDNGALLHAMEVAPYPDSAEPR